MTLSWTEAEIAAFLAGRLHGAEADRVAEALETDPAAQAAAEALTPAVPTIDARLRAAYAEAMVAPVPDSLRAAFREPAPGAPSPAAPFGLAPSRPAPLSRGRMATWTPTVLAASVALVAGIGAGWGLRGPGPGPSVTGPDGAAPAQIAAAVGPAAGPLAAVLEDRASGVAMDGVTVTATFLDAAGRPCREFETLDGSGAPLGAGVACRDAAGWRVLVAAAAPEDVQGGDDDGYAPAQGAAADPIGAVLSALEAGPALSPADEAALIMHDWR